MFKKIAFLAPRPDLSRAAFLRHWREVHGPTVAHAPGYARWRHRYVQNHIRGPVPAGMPFPFAGMAEFWLPDANEDDYALSPTYRDHVRPDEVNFIDMERTVSMTATEHVIRPGRGEWKLVVLVLREPAGVTSDDPADLLSRAAIAEVALPDVVRGYAVNLVQPESLRLPGGRRGPGPAIGAIHEFRFATSDSLDRPGTRETIAQAVHDVGSRETRGGTYSFLAEEIVFFDESRPTVASLDDRPAIEPLPDPHD